MDCATHLEPLLPVAEVAATRRTSIFIAEDDPVYRHLLQTWLQQWGYPVTVVEDGAAAWRELQSDHHPRLVLLDWMMPGLDGVEICRRIRALQRESYSYIIVVTARTAKQDAIAALQAGADDYLTKPVESSELRARIQVGQRILHLQDELLRSQDLLRFQATHDSLTGLWSRRNIVQVLKEELLRGGRTGAPIGALMLDIDHFKVVNDSHGHQVGDMVLAEVAARAVQVVRVYDKVGRYGGEEFLVVLPECPGDMLQCVAERIRSRVANSPVVTAGASVPVSVSIGGAFANSQPECDPDGIIRNADRALYRAKHAGRNCCVTTEQS